jgi:hypothetical protein
VESRDKSTLAFSYNEQGMTVYRSCRDNKHGFGIKQGAVSQNHLVNYVAALDATESPKGAMPAVALKIDTHFMVHVSAAPPAALPS